jgi:hypothetical protein
VFQVRRKLLSSLAALAVLLNAWMPTLSQAMAVPSPGGGWTEVCSAQGQRWIRVDEQGHVTAESDQRPDGAPAAGLHAACAYCLVHAASFGLPPTATGLGLLADVSWSPVRMPRAAPLKAGRRTWTTPAVRAPPAVI